MANKEQEALLKRGVPGWNAWRAKSDFRTIDLRRADLRDADLSGANLSGADLSRADLSRAILSSADLSHANLSRAILSDAHLSGAILSRAILSSADLSHADLSHANLSHAILSHADLSHANLSHADLSHANLSHAILSEAFLTESVFANTDLSGTKELDTCHHHGPSTIDHRTIQRSGQLSLTFLRGCGLPDALIDYLPSLLHQAIRMYSCFISYSSRDDEFVQRLHADLQNKGVRCWFAPHDMPIGARILDAVDDRSGYEISCFWFYLSMRSKATG